jgi:hypothetical protein
MILKIVMTSSHKPIRIIDRRQREISVADQAIPLQKTAQQLEREMVRTVKSWIDSRRKISLEISSVGWRHNP